MYTFLQKEQLLNRNQSGFRPSDSCINQLLSITHEIFQSLDATPPLQVRSVFLYISKAFDKVWHEGLLYKLNSIGIQEKCYKLMESYLSNRFQRVVLNGQTSSWRPILAGVPQGAILGPLLFLIYINGTPDGLKSNVRLHLFLALSRIKITVPKILPMTSGRFSRKCFLTQTVL